MANTTIKGREEWEYLGVLNVCIQIMLTILVGVGLGFAKIFSAKLFVPQATTFVFYVALPSLVVQGLGINIDIYDDNFLWSFISAFIILRGIALAVSFGLVLRSTKQGIGQVAVYWLALTWISTVILGVPICSAVFDNPMLGVSYGILAGISSFIFQLPVQLLFLECHRLEKDYIAMSTGVSTPKGVTDLESPQDGAVGILKSSGMKIHPEPEESPVGKVSVQNDVKMQDVDDILMDEKQVGDGNGDNEVEHVLTNTSKEAPPTDTPAEPSLCYFMQFSKKPEVWVCIVGQVVRNPVLIAIAIALFLTLSKIGPMYLKKTSVDYVPGLGWIPDTLKWLSDCVSPVSLLAMGVWMSEEGGNLFQMSNKDALLYMFAKLVLTPLVMVGLAKALDQSDVAGRAAVLIASLPISQASFSLASRYNIGEAVLSENAALGTILILPTIILWNIVLDSADIFPIPK